MKEAKPPSARLLQLSINFSEKDVKEAIASPDKTLPAYENKRLIQEKIKNS